MRSRLKGVLVQPRALPRFAGPGHDKGCGDSRECVLQTRPVGEVAVNRLRLRVRWRVFRIAGCQMQTMALPGQQLSRAAGNAPGVAGNQKSYSQRRIPRRKHSIATIRNRILHR